MPGPRGAGVDPDVLWGPGSRWLGAAILHGSLPVAPGAPYSAPPFWVCNFQTCADPPENPIPRGDPPSMEITDLDVEGYERVVRARDPESGLHAIVSVHDTTLGPALGGLRMLPYPSEEDALFDVKRLSRGMSFKSAVAHTGLGGGKAVILGDPKAIKSDALYLAMGRFIDSLDGLYITAEDVNTTVADLEIVRRATRSVAGLSRESGGSGNPSPYTAYGVYLGLVAGVQRVFGDASLKGRTVAVQGIGAVGSALSIRLAENGATVYACDMNQKRLGELAKSHGIEPVPLDKIMDMEVDVFAPCALGAILHDETIPQLRCKLVAGATNNPLLEPRHGEMLRDRGILYAPDYVINAGGIINVSVERAPGGYDEDTALSKIERIPEALHELWDLSDEESVAPNFAADRLAKKILAEGKAQKSGA